jgi:hypothetical protein
MKGIIHAKQVILVTGYPGPTAFSIYSLFS